MRNCLYLCVALSLLACNKKKADDRPKPSAPIADHGASMGMPSGGAPAQPSAAADGARKVAVTVSDKGFEPDTIPAKVGEKLDLVFTRTTTSECGGSVVIKSTGEKKDLPLNEPVEFAVVADKPGNLGFSCGMEMMQGSIVVQ